MAPPPPACRRRPLHRPAARHCAHRRDTQLRQRGSNDAAAAAADAAAAGFGALRLHPRLLPHQGVAVGQLLHLLPQGVGFRGPRRRPVRAPAAVSALPALALGNELFILQRAARALDGRYLRRCCCCYQGSEAEWLGLSVPESLPASRSLPVLPPPHTYGSHRHRWQRCCERGGDLALQADNQSIPRRS